jgi:hypothetical protein
MNCTRQGGKSSVAAILGLHQALYVPKSLILLVSPSLRQSKELFTKVVDYMDMLEHKPILDEDNALSCRLANRSRVVSLPGTHRTIRGYSGASLVIEDEAAQVDDALHYAVTPMVAVSGGRTILMSSPFGRRGHYFEAWENGGPSWYRATATAYDCPRIPPDWLEEQRELIPASVFASEYLCQFTEPFDAVFRLEDVRAAITSDVEPLFLKAIA